MPSVKVSCFVSFFNRPNKLQTKIYFILLTLYCHCFINVHATVYDYNGVLMLASVVDVHMYYLILLTCQKFKHYKAHLDIRSNFGIIHLFYKNYH